METSVGNQNHGFYYVVTTALTWLPQIIQAGLVIAAFVSVTFLLLKGYKYLLKVFQVKCPACKTSFAQEQTIEQLGAGWTNFGPTRGVRQGKERFILAAVYDHPILNVLLASVSPRFICPKCAEITVEGDLNSAIQSKLRIRRRYVYAALLIGFMSEVGLVAIKNPDSLGGFLFEELSPVRITEGNKLGSSSEGVSTGISGDQAEQFNGKTVVLGFPNGFVSTFLLMALIVALRKRAKQNRSRAKYRPGDPVFCPGCRIELGYTQELSKCPKCSHEIFSAVS
jgi:phage FluMu protein Com